MVFVSKEFSILPEVHLKQDVFIKSQPIGFIHISKTGGFNLNYLTEALIAQRGFEYIELMSPCESPELNKIANYKTANIVTEGCISGVQVLKKSPELFDLTNKPQVQFITGHMPLPTHDYFKVNVSYISIVRDPVDRALSLGNYLYQEGCIKKEAIETLLLDVEVDNLQTRWLAGDAYMHGECTEKTFEQALKNIQEKFIVVAPIEELDVLMSLVANHFGFYDVAFPKINVTGEKVVSKKNKELCHKILERNHYDKKLYDYVKTNWQSWKSDNIESITDNISNTKEYSVISPLFYSSINHKVDKIPSMNLNQINLLGSKTEELVSSPYANLEPDNSQGNLSATTKESSSYLTGDICQNDVCVSIPMAITICVAILVVGIFLIIRKKK